MEATSSFSSAGSSSNFSHSYSTPSLGHDYQGDELQQLPAPPPPPCHAADDEQELHEGADCGIVQIPASPAAPPTSSSLQVYDLVVAGGGLAGLVAAYRFLQRRETGTVLILDMSKERLGGRILSDENGVDLGPAWIWPRHQPRITALLREVLPSDFQSSLIVPQAGGFSGEVRLRGGVAVLAQALQKELTTSPLYKDRVHIEFGQQLTELIDDAVCGHVVVGVNHADTVAVLKAKHEADLAAREMHSLTTSTSSPSTLGFGGGGSLGLGLAAGSCQLYTNSNYSPSMSPFSSASSAPSSCFEIDLYHGGVTTTLTASSALPPMQLGAADGGVVLSSLQLQQAPPPPPPQHHHNLMHAAAGPNPNIPIQAGGPRLHQHQLLSGAAGAPPGGANPTAKKGKNKRRSRKERVYFPTQTRFFGKQVVLAFPPKKVLSEVRFSCGNSAALAAAPGQAAAQLQEQQMIAGSEKIVKKSGTATEFYVAESSEEEPASGIQCQEREQQVVEVTTTSTSSSTGAAGKKRNDSLTPHVPQLPPSYPSYLHGSLRRRMGSQSIWMAGAGKLVLYYRERWWAPHAATRLRLAPTQDYGAFQVYDAGEVQVPNLDAKQQLQMTAPIEDEDDDNADTAGAGGGASCGNVGRENKTCSTTTLYALSFFVSTTAGATSNGKLPLGGGVAAPASSGGPGSSRFFPKQTVTGPMMAQRVSEQLSDPTTPFSIGIEVSSNYAMATFKDWHRDAAVQVPGRDASGLPVTPKPIKGLNERVPGRRIWFGNSEASDNWTGMLEGAVLAAENAVGAVAEGLDEQEQAEQDDEQDAVIIPGSSSTSCEIPPSAAEQEEDGEKVDQGYSDVAADEVAGMRPLFTSCPPCVEEEGRYAEEDEMSGDAGVEAMTPKSWVDERWRGG